jgi:hypothetical protein
MVSGKKNAPSVRHATREAAEAEADRLAEHHIGDLFYVMEACSEHGAYASLTRSDMEELPALEPEAKDQEAPGEDGALLRAARKMKDVKVDV